MRGMRAARLAAAEQAAALLCPPRIRSVPYRPPPPALSSSAPPLADQQTEAEQTAYTRDDWAAAEATGRRASGLFTGCAAPVPSRQDSCAADSLNAHRHAHARTSVERIDTWTCAPLLCCYLTNSSR